MEEGWGSLLASPPVVGTTADSAMEGQL